MCFKIEQFIYWLLFEDDDDELEERIRITNQQWERYYNWHLKQLNKVSKFLMNIFN